MPQFQPLTATTAIPSAGTLLVVEPVVIDGPRAVYAGLVKPGGTAPANPVATVLEPSLQISLRKPSKTSRASKFQLTLIMPQATVDTEGNPLRTKDREARADFTLTTSERATDDERQQILDLMVELLYNGQVREVSVNNKTIY